MSVRAGLVVATLVLLVVWILSDVVWAQVSPPPPIVPAPTPLPKELPKPEPPVPSILPPVPVPERRGPIPTVKVYVREIRVLGSTVFKPEELAQVTDPYRDRSYRGLVPGVRRQTHPTGEVRVRMSLAGSGKTRSVWLSG